MATKRHSVNDTAVEAMVKWAVGAVMVIILTLAVAWTKGDSYSNAEIDAKLQVQGEQIRALKEQVEDIHEDVKWLVRKEGGVPADEGEEK